MNWKTWIPLVLALVLGLVAMKVARNMMNKNSGPAQEQGTQVVILNKDLSPGTAIAPEDLGTTRMTGEVNHEAVFARSEDVTGRVLVAQGMKGTPVLQAMLAPKGAGSGLQSLIPDGMRAITIEINEFTGVAGNLTSGSRVDITATMNGENGEMMTRTIVQNIKVQSIGMRRATETGEAPPPSRSITLLATPKEAETIELAISTGKTRLLLRGTSDNAPAGTEGVTFAELRRSSSGSFGEDPFSVQPVEMVKPANPQGGPTTQPQPVAQTEVRKPRRTDRQVKIIRGGVETETTVPEVASPTGSRWMTGAGLEEVPAINGDN